MDLCFVIKDPVVPSPVTMFITPFGMPASMQICANNKAVNDVYSAGFKITVLPIAIAGAIFQESINNGKFHGII